MNIWQKVVYMAMWLLGVSILFINPNQSTTEILIAEFMLLYSSAKFLGEIK